MNIVYVDFETYYDSEYSLSKMTTEAYVRDPRFEVIGVSVAVDNGTPVWMHPSQFAVFVSSVNWETVGVCAHHAHFDGLILSHHYGKSPAFWFDTLSMSRALNGSRVGNSLDALLRYYELGVKGTEAQEFRGMRLKDFSPEQYARYGAYSNNDNEGCRALFRKFLPSFPKNELALIDVTVRMFTEPVLQGKVDVLTEHLTYELNRKEELLKQCGLERADLSSSDRFADALRSVGVDPETKVTPKGNRIYAFAKTDPEFQSLLESEDDDVRILAEARQAVKSTQSETRTVRLIGMSRRGTLPVYLKYGAAHTLRWGGGDSMNWQNFERTNKKDPRKGRIRKSICAPPGKTLVVADSSQIEARFNAWLSGQLDLVNQFARGEDVYSIFASEAYGRKIDRKNNPDDQIPGFVGKICVLGLGYGMGYFKLALELLKGAMGSPPVQFTRAEIEKLNVNVDRFLAYPPNVERARSLPSRLNEVERLIHCAVANHFVETYRRKNAAIPALWKFSDRIIEQMYLGERGPRYALGVISLVEDGLMLPSGMVMRYPHIHKSEDGSYSYLSGKNQRTRLYGPLLVENIVQACCRIIVSDSMVRLKNEFECGMLRGHGQIVMMSHDEIVACVDDGAAQDCKDFLFADMKKPPEWAPGLPLSVDGGIGTVYGDIDK